MGWFTNKALFGAVSNSDYDTARIALTKGADPNGHNKGWTPLLRACAKGDLQMIKILVAAGADPVRQNTSGTDVFSFCREQGLDELAEAVRVIVSNCEAKRSFGVDPWKEYAL